MMKKSLKMMSMTIKKKDKLSTTTKTTTTTLTNMTKWMKMSEPIFYKNQTNFRSYMKPRTNIRLFSRKQQTTRTNNYLRNQTKTMIQEVNETSL